MGGKYFNKRICDSVYALTELYWSSLKLNFDLVPFSLPPKYFGRILIWLSYITYINLKKIVWGESIFIRGYVDQICTNGGILVFVEVELWPCSFLFPTKIFWSKDNMTKLYNICEFKENRMGVKYFYKRICRSDMRKRRYISPQYNWTLTLFLSHSHQNILIEY